MIMVLFFIGLPRLLRCDRGTENSKVAFLQPFLRRNGQDASSGIRSFQYGCSVTNLASNPVIVDKLVTLYIWHCIENRKVLGYTAQMVFRLVNGVF